MWFSCVYFYSVHLERSYYRCLWMGLVEGPSRLQAFLAHGTVRLGALAALQDSQRAYGGPSVKKKKNLKDQKAKFPPLWKSYVKITCNTEYRSKPKMLVS